MTTRYDRAKALERKYGVTIKVTKTGAYLINGARTATTLKAAERIAMESTRLRGVNPRMQNMFVLLATRGKTVLKYVGGIRFSNKGRAVLFPSRSDAVKTARDLKSRFPQALRGYTLRVQS